MPNSRESLAIPQRLLPVLVALAAATALAIPIRACAQTFPEVGARAMGMAGAFVAAANGPTADYWNPAALALEPPGGAFVYGTTPSDPDDLSADLDGLASTNALSPDIVDRPADAVRAVGLLSAIDAHEAPVTVARPVGGFYGGGRYGVSIYRTTFAAARALVDTTHIQPSNDPATGLPYNTSVLVSKELRLDDYVVSLAGDLGDNKFYYGGSVRYSHGETFLSARSLFDLDGFKPSDTIDLAEDAFTSVKDSDWSFDLSALFIPAPTVRLGVIGKYLGAPKFELADGSTFKLEPRWRTGIAITPSPSFTLSADVDLTKTALLDDTSEERDLAVGGEARFSNGRVALRGGVRTSLEGPSATLLSGGLGIVGGGFRVDFAAGRTSGSGATALTVEIAFAGQKK